MASSVVGVLRRKASGPIAPKLLTNQSFGRAGDSPKVETREDEEQNIKLQEIIDLLLAAGYFRARIKGLSPFDKVVGGMTWCIETCNVDIDVDLLFQENLTIGQKIALTEKIVVVLPKMKCPYRIEPHQIQGLDCIHIFPVIQWLVKRAIETRQEMGDYIRAYSIFQFNKSHATHEDLDFDAFKTKMSSALHDVKDTYRPRRLYRHHAPNKIRDEESRVQITLLEYGRKARLGKALQADKSDEAHATTGDTVDQKSDAADVQRIQKLMSSMSVMEEHESKLTASTVGSIVGLQSAEIQQMASEFADKKAELASEERGEKGLGGMQHHKRLVASLKNQIAEKTTKCSEAQVKCDELKKLHEKTQDDLKELQDRYKTMIDEIKKMDEVETGENRSVLQKLRSLVAMNENLKRQEKEFRLHCKEELARLKTEIEELKSSADEGTSEDQERRQLIEKQHAADKERLQKIRVLLAQKNREIASLQRKIDEVPSRAELSQYQKRFIELYNQVAAKHKETKQFYTLYNTLEDTRRYLEKEVNLLNSIQDNFTEAMSSPATRDQFLNQLDKIVDGIRQNKIWVEKRKQEEKMKRDQFNDQYLDLIEKQRLYFKTVKDFKEECRKNEILVVQLKEKGKKTITEEETRTVLDT